MSNEFLDARGSVRRIWYAEEHGGRSKQAMYGLCFKERALIFSTEWGVSMHLKDKKTCFKAISLILIGYLDIFSLTGAFVLWYKRKNAYFQQRVGRLNAFEGRTGLF